MDYASALSRRGFLKASAAVSAVALGSRFAHAAGSDRLKLGLVGCGGRGLSAAAEALSSSEGLEIWSVGDVFQDRAEQARDRLRVGQDRCFWGWDAYQKVIDSGVDVVMLATPPGFRPMHFKAAVEAGKHVFMEKPVAVDPTGVRTVLEAAQLAETKKLSVVAGTQRRHQKSYIDTIARLHDGAIGEIVQVCVYWNQGGLWRQPRREKQSEMEWQLRNWYYFCWLGGDHIVEQHIHNLDVANWVLKAHPIAAHGMGGRQVRTDPAYGQIYDHFCVEYEYASGAKVVSMCRQMDGTDSRIGEYVIGTKGTANPARSLQLKGQEMAQGFGGGRNPYVQEHADLVASIRSGRPLNEAKQVAESTMTAIMGRMSAYTGKRVTWDFAMKSKLDLMPSRLEFGPVPKSTLEVPVPGKEPLI